MSATKIWKQIPGYNYEISNDGVVRNLKNNKIISQYEVHGRPSASLNRKQNMVRILLAEVFPSDPEVEWKKIPIHDYAINGEGDIRNMRDKGKILKQDFKNNAFYVHLYKDSDAKHYQVQILLEDIFPEIYFFHFNYFFLYKMIKQMNQVFQTRIRSEIYLEYYNKMIKPSVAFDN
jgi:hypothetical protein